MMVKFPKQQSFQAPWTPPPTEAPPTPGTEAPGKLRTPQTLVISWHTQYITCVRNYIYIYIYISVYTIYIMYYYIYNMCINSIHYILTICILYYIYIYIHPTVHSENIKAPSPLSFRAAIAKASGVFWMPPKRNGSVLDLFIFGFLIGGIDIVSGMFENYFLRVIPTMKHYSDIVSDMSSGSIYIYGIVILTLYPTFFLAYTLQFYLTFYLASILTFFLAFYLIFSLAVSL